MLGAPIVAAGALGAAVYGGRVMFSVPRKEKGTRIDPFILSEPWRSYVQGAQSAKLRFDRTVEGTRDGPLRDRLRELSSRLEDGIEESWRIASRGDDIDGALKQLNTKQAEIELAQLQARHRDPDSSSDVESTIASLQAQITSGQRMQRVSQSTRDRLRLLDARFDELVARAVEVSVGSEDSGVLGNDVNDLVTELESLRLALDDTQRTERGELPPEVRGQAAGEIAGETPSPQPEQKPETWPKQ